MNYKDKQSTFISMDLKEMRPEGFLNTILDRQLNNIRAVDSGSGWKTRELCPLCKSTKKTFQFTKYDFELNQCNDCEIAFFNKIPVNTNDLYSAPHAIEYAQEAYLSNVDYRKVRFAEERVKMIEENLGKNISNLNILDVGCGTGWFLEVAKEHGANCSGLELGEELARFTSERIGIPVWNCDLKNLNVDEKYDVITMFDLIEHVEDPLDLVKVAKGLLKEEGIILIFTPQFDSVAIQTMKDKSNLVMPAEHLSYFNEKSVEVLAELSDMDLNYFETKGIDLGDLKAFYEYSNQPNLAESCETLYDIIQPCIDESKSGNHLRAILKKK
ncbi:class I SAM-dependent methyltransferase [Lysinibacillus sp. NPDC047702]|uniref:class I SAM-dependent methyltransferase n=1 Tax=unclassified Lysinibacillus TaxID=2636778 RepID=UPI003D06A3E5